MTAWTTAADIRARARRRWDDGTILRSVAADAPVPVIDVPLRGPRPGDIGDALDAVRSWIAGLEAGSRSGSRYTVRYVLVGGRLIGRNSLPSHAVVESYEQAVALLGVGDLLWVYQNGLSAVEPDPVVLACVAAIQLRALVTAVEWQTLLYD